MQATVKNIADVPEALRGEYVQQGDVFVLKVDGELPGLAPASRVNELTGKVNEFRENNVKLMNDIKAAQEKLKAYDGIDPVEHAALKAKVTTLQSQAGITSAEDVAARVKREVEAAIAPYATKVTALETERDQTKRKLAERELDALLTRVGGEAGIDDKAMPDFLSRGRQKFQHDESGQIVAKDEKGQPVFSRAKAGELLSPLEWATGLTTEAPHLFRRSQGAQTPGGTGTRTDRDGVTWVAADPLEIGRNVEDIASGKARVAS